MHAGHALCLVAAAFATVAALGAVLGSAHAQTYPAKSITLVVPLAAGTGMDSIARLYGEELSHTLGKPIVVDNRPGAAMMLALTALARAQPDGYTLGIATSGPFATNPVLYKKIDYDPFEGSGRTVLDGFQQVVRQRFSENLEIALQRFFRRGLRLWQGDGGHPGGSGSLS